MSEYQYCSYYYNYEKNHTMLLNLRDAAAPEIYMAQLAVDKGGAGGGGQVTERRVSGHSDEKRMEQFRLSFGKDSSDSNYRTL